MNAISHHSSQTSPAKSLPALNRLSPNQHLLVFAMRKWAVGPTALPDVAQTLFKVFGIYHIEAALQAFETLMQALADKPQNPFSIHELPHLEVGSGELAVLKLITAFQAGDLQTARTLALEIAGPEGNRSVFTSGCQLAKCLDARSILFTLREYKPLAMVAVEGRA